MVASELLRRWVPVGFLAIGVSFGVYFKRRPKPVVDEVPTRELQRQERCDSHGWCTQLLPGGPPQQATFAATWAAGADDVWAVGLSGVAVHWDGSAWSSVPTNTPTLRGVYGFATDDVWLVGGKRALHWEGAQLAPYELQLEGELTDVFGVARDDIWAVSSRGETAHWNGATWRVIEASFDGQFETVWGSATNDYWAAGSPLDEGARGVIAHWDGQKWTQSELPCHCTVSALSGTSSKDVWAVGSWGNILHYDGRAWTRWPSPARRGLMGLDAQAPDDVWAVGEESTVLHYDGNSWTAVKPEWRWLRAVTATPTDVWAVGHEGWIVRWQPEAFEDKLRAPPASTQQASASSSTTPQERGAMGADARKALDVARQLQREGKHEQARRAFVAALGTGTTVHLEPLAELARLMATQERDNDEVEGAFLTVANTNDPDLEASTWHDLASLYQRQNRPEKARAALARALSRSDANVITKSLAGRSPCLAEIPTATPADLPLPNVVTGWRGVCEAVELCASAERVSEAAARERVCSLSDERGEVRSNGCAKVGPWQFRYRIGPFESISAWVYELHASPSPRFFVGTQTQMSNPGTCIGSLTSNWHESGGYAWFTSAHEPLWSLPGRALPLADADTGVCGASAKTTTTGLFELNTGRPLAVVTRIDKYPVELVLDPSFARLTLRGSQCDGHIALDGTMRWVPN